MRHNAARIILLLSLFSLFIPLTGVAEESAEYDSSYDFYYDSYLGVLVYEDSNSGVAEFFDPISGESLGYVYVPPKGPTSGKDYVSDPVPVEDFS